MAEQETLLNGASSIDKVASGQRMIICAIVLYLATQLFGGAAALAPVEIGSWLGLLVFMLWLLSYALAFLGLLRLASGMGYSDLFTVLLLVTAFIPLLNLLVLLLVNGRATAALRAAGYDVGLLGVRR